MRNTSQLSDPISPLELSPEEIEFYKSEGWLLLPNLLKPEFVSSIRNDILNVVKELGTQSQDLSQASDTSHKLIQTSQYLAGSPIDSFVNSPKLNSIAASLLGGIAHLYMPFTAVKSARGGGEFHFHQDNNYTTFENGMHGVNIWFALVDMVPENGCLCIEPRTHLDGTFASENVGQGDHHRRIAYEPKNYLPVRMRAGDAVAFSRITVHGSGKNVTEEPRVGYSVQFHHEDTQATWDGQPKRPLKGANRWHTTPVQAIEMATEPDDG
ncbi:phytanoyl-CoA dioxygenase [Vibrio nigripulchritudo ATCC 27043]|uniref:phytanoyl-CoA dioxygenase family protein n=1 Tax=Vibrio nigripulchritudo TaxID=28173 RepID=UPI00021C1BF5|nr:phytanoyl-CoA dioxygenase family protein [Vibrio nigripulchritudo]EGU57628.1 phytanoyl-CoA dioxygenase [Vibrio nigripulchritudo ATCC 27043]